jgi:hypothetical protein
VLGTAVVACGQYAAPRSTPAGHGANSAVSPCRVTSIVVRLSQPGRPALEISGTSATGRVPGSGGFFNFVTTTLSAADLAQLDSLACAEVARYGATPTAITSNKQPSIGGQLFVTAVTTEGTLAASFDQSAAQTDPLVIALRAASERYFGSAF